MTTFSGLYEKVLLGPKLIYITLSLFYYGFYVYRTKWATEILGFDTAGFGDMSALMALIGFISMTLWGSLADFTGRPRLILALVSVGVVASFSLFLLDIKGQSWEVGANFGILALYSCFSSSVPALADDQVLRLLSTIDTRLYGNQRAFETLSFAVTTRVLAWLFELFGIRVVLHLWIPCTALLFIIVVALVGTDRIKTSLGDNNAGHVEEQRGLKQSDTIIEDNPANVLLSTKVCESSTNLLVSSQQPTRSSAEPVASHETKRPVFILLTNRNYLFLLFGVFLTGYARSIMTTFLTHYLLNDMHLTEGQCGDVAISGVIFEALIFFCSAHLIRRFGLYWILILAQLAMVVRGWSYVWMAPVPANWWIVYLVELLKGVAFGLTQSAGIKIANDIVPSGLEATSQSLYSGMYAFLPGVIAAFVGGRIYQTFGSTTLFVSTAVISTVALLLFILKYSWDGKLRPIGNSRLYLQ